MVNNNENIAIKLQEDLYKYVTDMAFIGSTRCCYHFDYTGITVEDLHNAMLYLYDRGFDVEIDICAHINVYWEDATRGEAAECKKLAKDISKATDKIWKKIFKNGYAMVSSDEKFYDNIKKFLEYCAEENGDFKLAYINTDDKEFVFAVKYIPKIDLEGLVSV